MVEETEDEEGVLTEGMMKNMGIAFEPLMRLNRGKKILLLDRTNDSILVVRLRQIGLTETLAVYLNATGVERFENSSYWILAKNKVVGMVADIDEVRENWERKGKE